MKRIIPYQGKTLTLKETPMRRLRHFCAWLSVTMVTLSITAGIAFAASVHLKPPNKNPTFRDLGLALRATGALAGLGNEDLLVSLTAQADVTATCTNPGSGEHQPPGQNPAPITVTGAVGIPASEIKNGNVDFSVTTQEPTTPIEGAPDCPNPNWTEDIVDLAFTSATITVQQPPGNVVLTVVCTFSEPTSDGLVPSENVSCTVS
jgi:hypothetical protein